MAEYHLKPLPPGTRIYSERLAVAGIQHRRADALRFVRGKELSIALEREPTNAVDPNALKVLGSWRGWFSTKTVQLGYVPRDTARVVADGGYWPDIQPRLLKTYAGSDGYVEVEFQLIGPADRAAEFKASFSSEDHYTNAVDQVRYLKSEGRLDDAIALLQRLVQAVEAESAREGARWGVAPWYYEQLAICFRKQHRIADEVAILERYMAQTHAPGVQPAKLAERLTKARALLARSK